MELSEKHSGYELTKSEWIEFLECWERESNSKLDLDDSTFFKFDKKRSRINSSVIKKGFPSSFIDFHQAYIELGGIYREGNVDDGIGIFSLDKIQPFATYMRDLMKIKSEWPIESNDSEYYKYGTDQDSASGRTSYLKNAIVVGQYGFSDYELIVLYPNSKTKDGEFETALFAHASEARTPSFVEMMRHLSYLYIEKPDFIPPYSQDQLIGTCADKLPLKDVWWK